MGRISPESLRKYAEDIDDVLRDNDELVTIDRTFGGSLRQERDRAMKKYVEIVGPNIVQEHGTVQ